MGTLRTKDIMPLLLSVRMASLMTLLLLAIPLCHSTESANVGQRTLLGSSPSPPTTTSSPTTRSPTASPTMAPLELTQCGPRHDFYNVNNTCCGESLQKSLLHPNPGNIVQHPAVTNISHGGVSYADTLSGTNWTCATLRIVYQYNSCCANSTTKSLQHALRVPRNQ